MVHFLYNGENATKFEVVDGGVEVDYRLVTIEDARKEYRRLLDDGATKCPPPAAGSFAATARFMARGDRSGFDWDAWKDDMKDRRW